MHRRSELNGSEEEEEEWCLKIMTMSNKIPNKLDSTHDLQLEKESRMRK
jgi:hypothetical protein